MTPVSTALLENFTLNLKLLVDNSRKLFFTFEPKGIHLLMFKLQFKSPED
jgi:hypothetical protein